MNTLKKQGAILVQRASAKVAGFPKTCKQAPEEKDHLQWARASAPSTITCGVLPTLPFISIRLPGAD